MDCNFDSGSGFCSVCGATGQPGLHRNCGFGLGDKIEAGLKALGITQASVSAWIGGPCNCPERIERLNRLGRYLEKRAAKLGIKLPF